VLAATIDPTHTYLPGENTMTLQRCCLTSVLLTIALGLQSAPAADFIQFQEDSHGGGYQAFPDVCRLQDGRLMAVFYSSYAHVGLPNQDHPKGGGIACCTSSDEGHSWSMPQTLYDGPDDDRDPSITQLPNGKLLCNFFSLRNKTAADKPQPQPYVFAGTWIVTSDDLGKTWSAARKLYDDYPCSSPVRVLAGGRLILPLYSEGGKRCGAVGISDDGGKTWSKPIDIDNGGVNLDAETDVIELGDGRLWAVQRSSHAPACYTTSTDNGNTWTKSQPIGFVAHCPYLLRTASDPNIILLGFRGYKTLNASDGAVTTLRYSLDECKTWSKAFSVDTYGGAYPSMVNLKDGSVLIVYYEEGPQSHIRVKRFRVSKDGIQWLAP
jgi:sialidase-1